MFLADNLGFFAGVNDFKLALKSLPENCSLAGYYSTFW